MKTSSFVKRSIFALVLLAAPFAARASNFEGRVDMQISNPKKPTEPMIFHYTIKDHRLRFDIPAQNSGHGTSSLVMIIDYDAKQMITLIDTTGADGEERKMAMRHALPEPKAETGKNAEETAHIPVATGRTDTILGYPATEYALTAKNGTVTELWLTKNLGNFMSPSAQGFGGRRPTTANAAEWENFARNAGFFPLRVVAHDKDGKQTVSMEVVKIDKTSVPDSAFSTEGYQEMQMPSFGGMMNGFLGH